MIKNIFLLFINNLLPIFASSLKFIYMKSNTTTILKVMQVITWVVFIGLCIMAGVLIFTVLMSLFFDPQAAHDLHLGLDLSDLLETSRWKYICLTSLIIFLTGLKAWFFYRIIRLLKVFNMSQPFDDVIIPILTKISRTALEIGILALIAREFVRSLIKQGTELPSMHDYLGGGIEFLFMAGIIFIIAQVFKRGLEIQTENELTI